MTASSKKLAIGVSVMMLLTVLQRGAGLFAMAVLARLLDSRALGAYAFTNSTSASAAALTRIGIDAGLHLRLAGGAQSESTDTLAAMISQAVLVMLAPVVLVAVSMIVLAEWIATEWFHAPDLAPYVGAAAVLMAAQAVTQFCYAVFAGTNNFSTYARWTGLSAIGCALSAIGGGLLHGGLGAAWGLVGAQALSACILAAAALKMLAARGIRLTPMWPGPIVLDLLKIGLPFSLGVLVLAPAELFGSSLLSQTAGVAALGDQRITQSLLTVAAMLPNAIAGPLTTFLTARRQANKTNHEVLFQLRLFWAFALLSAIVLCSIFPILVRILFGANFKAAEMYGPLALGGYVGTMILVVLQSGLLANHAARSLLVIGVATASVLSLLYGLLIPALGLAGLFIAQAGGYAAAVLLAYARLNGLKPMYSPARWRSCLLLATVFTAVLIVYCVWADPSMIARVSICAIAAGAIGCALWFNVFTAIERSQLIGFVHSSRQELIQRLRGNGVAVD